MTSRRAIALTLTALAAAVGCGTSGAVEVPLYPVPFKAADGRLQVFDGAEFRPMFIKGMNLGVGLPGTQPGELAPTADAYARWFSMMSEMGVNAIRVYTLHYPRFYERLHFFNVTHPDKPLYVFLGIWLDEARNVARFSLTSYAGNSSTDRWAGSGARLGNARGPVVVNAPYYNGAKVYSSAAAADAWVNANQKNSARAFAVHLQYAFIPTSIVAGEDYFTGTSRAPSSGKEFQPRSAIQGFEFYFDNKAHHIRELGVMPRLPGSSVSSRAPAGEFIAFQDKNRDDPIKWAVKLLTIKP